MYKILEKSNINGILSIPWAPLFSVRNNKIGFTLANASIGKYFTCYATHKIMGRRKSVQRERKRKRNR